MKRDVLTFLQPVGRQRARKVHCLITTAAGFRLETQSYGKARDFRFTVAPVSDIEDVFAALELSLIHIYPPKPLQSRSRT